MHRTILLLLAALAGSLLSISFPPTATEGATLPSSGLRWAYYVPDDPTALDSLRQRSGDLDFVGLHWGAMQEDRSIELKANPDVIRLVRSIGAKPILSVSLGSGGADTGQALLATEESRSATVSALAAATSDYDGISIDFEGLRPEDRDALTRFMAQLAERLRPAGKLVTMALSAKTTDTRTGWAGALDYAGLAPNSDLFVIMAYGYRTARSSVPGSIGPFAWVNSTVDFAISQIPREKLLLGLGLYGYDWDTTSGPPAKALRYPEIVSIANQWGATIQHDPTQQSAHLSYSKDGHNHEVWFEDRATMEAKLAIVTQQKLAGVATWRLGHEDPQVWQAVNALRQPTTAPTGSQAAISLQPISQSSTKSWYFAEGSSAPPFDSWFLLQNPNTVPVIAHLTFMPEGASPVSRDLLLNPTSRTSVFANQIVPNAAFSTRIDADQPLLVERAMYAGFDGHVVTAITNPSRNWYFADGATTTPFHTWLLLQNPNPTASTVRVSYLLENGATVPQTLLLAPNSRTSIFTNQVIPNTAFSTRVDSDQPIIAERAMYRFPGNAATGVTGVDTPARNWYFGAGLPTVKNTPVDSWLLLQNPAQQAVMANITLLSTDRQSYSFQQLLPPTSRQSLFLNQRFSAPSFGVKVEANGEIVAERSVFLGATASSGYELQGAYASQGASQLGTVWALAEGSTAPPFSEKISVLNPNSSPMQITFELMLENGQVVVQNSTLAPNQALDFDPAGVVASGSFSAKVTTSLPSAVERTMCWTKNGKIGAHGTIGIRIQ